MKIWLLGKRTDITLQMLTVPKSAMDTKQNSINQQSVKENLTPEHDGRTTEILIPS